VSIATDDSTPEFSIRLPSIEALFDELDSRPVSERALTPEVRGHLLDDWDRLRDDWPSVLVIYAPASERAEVDENAIRAAIQADLHAASGSLNLIDPLPRRDRIAARIGITFLFACIMISTILDRISDDVLLAGVSQGILVLGWVALWRPAERLVTEVVPHFFNRRRFAEFAAIDIRFAWT
jgi:hypothetical protein